MSESLTAEQIEEHLITIRMHLDPDSPFQGMINFNDGLMALPIPQQQQIYDAMPDDLRTMVEAPK
jgi:hypothetical protein